MKKHIIYILMLLLFSTAVLSCTAFDAEMSPTDPEGPDMEFALSISGTVSDIENPEIKPEDIRITINAMQRDVIVYTKTAYTDNKGKFMLSLDGFRKPSSIVATAKDMKGVYKSSTHEMLISWDAYYNIKNGVFYLNECNFHLEKAE